MTSPLTPLTATEQRLVFEYSALRSGLGQGEAPEGFFFTPSPKIKKVDPGQEKTTMRFYGIDLANRTVGLRYARETTPTPVILTNLQGVNKDLAEVKPGVASVELQRTDPNDLTKPPVLQIALPQEVDFLVTAKIKKPPAGQTITTMKFSPDNYPSNTTLIILRYPAGPVTRPATDVDANNKELANVTFDENLKVELQAGATTLDIFLADVET